MNHMLAALPRGGWDDQLLCSLPQCRIRRREDAVTCDDNIFTRTAGRAVMVINCHHPGIVNGGQLMLLT